MSFRPLHDRVLVRRVEAEEKTAGGIIIPDSAKEKPQEGEVVAVGTGARADDGKVTPLDVKAGDRILFGKWSGTEVKISGEDLIITLATAGETLTIEGEFSYSAWFTWQDVELFRFADNTEWTKSDIQVALLASTAGDDHIVGFHSADVLDGGAGNDILEGGNGSDTYHFRLGLGDDVIRETRTNANLDENDRLVFAADILPEDDPQREVVVGYKTAYEEATGSPVSTFGGHAYDAFQILVDAIERAGSTEPEAIRDAIEQTQGFVGTAGVVNMSPEDHLGLDLTAFRMLEIRDGDWTVVQ